MVYTADTLYDRLVGQYGFDPGDLDDFFRVNSKKQWITYINKGETDVDRLGEVIEEWLGYINPMDESMSNMTLDDLMEAFDDPAVIIKPSKFNDFDIYTKDTNEWIATVSVERGIICVANKEGNLQFPIKYLDKAIAKTYKNFNESCDFTEAKELLESVGYRVINEREVNLDNLVKDIFEVLTSFGIAAKDDEVEKLIWTFIESGRDAEHANAEDVLEFDIDNEPDTIINYTGEFVDWIKRGQYKTGPVDESARPMNEDADEPATRKQLWALFCIYKKDFRNQGLTKGEAAEMISKAQEEKPYVKTKGKSLDKQICEHIETYLKPKLDEKMEEAFGMQSVVGDADLEGNLIPGGKRYKFFGGGCGFAWLKYDKRNKKIGEIEDKYEEIYRDKYFEKFAKEYIKKYGERDMGGVLSQDLNIQYTIKYAIVDFMKKIGMDVDKVSVYGRLD